MKAYGMEIADERSSLGGPSLLILKIHMGTDSSSPRGDFMSPELIRILGAGCSGHRSGL